MCRKALAALLAAGAVSAQPAPLRWPLDLPPVLSSTFGETRPSRFHLGIDLKTGGQTGCEVHAVADGWVEHVRTSPWGYGRALYQRLADGRIAVYAHLEGFFPPVAQRVLAAQRQDRRYSVDLWLEPGAVPVTKGQVIARSGASGVGPPHLHLELRDGDNAPLNPLLHGLGGQVADTTPPTLVRLLVQPLGPESTVEGGYLPVAVPLRWAEESGLYEASAPVRAWGRVALAVESFDRADEADNNLAALSHVLSVDGQALLTSRYERVSYDDNHQAALDRLRPGPDLGGGVYHALFRSPGNRLSFYQAAASGGDGTLTCGSGGLRPGDHLVEVAAADAAGNRSQLRLVLRVAAPPRIRWARLVPEGGSWYLEADLTDGDSEGVTVELSASPDGQRWEPSGRYPAGAKGGPFTWALAGAAAHWRLAVGDGSGLTQTAVLATPADRPAADPLELTVRVRPRPRHALLEIESPRPLHSTPRLAIAGVRGLPDLHQVGPWRFQAVVDLAELSGDSVEVTVAATASDGATGQRRLVLSRQPARPGEARDLHFLSDRVELRLDSGSAYDVWYPQARALQPQASAGLRATALGCELGPADAAFDQHAGLWLAVPEGESPARLGVYADDGRGRWVFLGAEGDGSGRRLGARVRGLGRFALMSDEIPPDVGRVRPQSGAVTDGRPTMSATVSDQGSGIGAEQDVVMELDGVRLISEYDPEAGRVEAAPDTALAPGVHELVVTVRDRAGNQSRVRQSFTAR